MGGTVSVCGAIHAKVNEHFKTGRYADAVLIHSQALDADPQARSPPGSSSLLSTSGKMCSRQPGSFRCLALHISQKQFRNRETTRRIRSLEAAQAST